MSLAVFAFAGAQGTRCVRADDEAWSIGPMSSCVQIVDTNLRDLEVDASRPVRNAIRYTVTGLLPKTQRASAAAVSSNCRYVACWSGGLKIVDLRGSNWRKVADLLDEETDVVAMDVSSCGSSVVLGTSQGHALVLHLDGRDMLGASFTADVSISSVLARNSEAILVATVDGEVVTVRGGTTDRVGRSGILPRFVAGQHGEGAIPLCTGSKVVWLPEDDPSRGHEVDSPVQAAALLDQQCVVVCCADGSVRLVNLRSQREVSRVSFDASTLGPVLSTQFDERTRELVIVFTTQVIVRFRIEGT